MPAVGTNLDDLASELRAREALSGIIGVDGWTGVGKTTLAEALATIVGGSCYDLDRALTHDQKQYVSALRFPELAEALAQSQRPLCVSGLCLLEALDRSTHTSTSNEWRLGGGLMRTSLPVRFQKWQEQAARRFGSNSGRTTKNGGRT